jgi:hypothetical protein
MKVYTGRVVSTYLDNSRQHIVVAYQGHRKDRKELPTFFRFNPTPIGFDTLRFGEPVLLSVNGSNHNLHLRGHSFEVERDLAILMDKP